ncbi:M23 family metallopeptidase [Metabacillus halosaccharovorans]|uniref:M23 family metallopeptidase n=1 Tax=Bacillaceae TaxID=186817 RepID=UPI00047E2986|nr:M23 family metallopeptidase [Bacillus sp. J37]
MKKVASLIIIFMVIQLSVQTSVFGAEKTDQQKEYEKLMSLYRKVETITSIPWYVLAAVDQYERNVRHSRKDIPKADGSIEIYIKPEVWAGPLNPNPDDKNPASIGLFGGIGEDGDGDKKADPKNDEDVLYSFAHYLQSYGTDLENLKIGLWDYYQRDKSVGLILGHMKLYKHYGRLDLGKHTFPVPLGHNFSYKNTWGDARGWGGRRIHEGTDIFANYGVPVRSTCYGVIEMKGWNRFGGWRVGIRDINNTYHYFAHLNGFADGLNVGQIVEPGQLIGSVGSSGYGPPGTAGKFPPHLHYGLYKDNGRTEWSFDPFPHLKSWERADRAERRKK